MLWKKFKFKTLDFTDSVQRASQQANGYSYTLQDKDDDINVKTEIVENSNYHGGVASHTLAWLRYFNFAGVAIGLDKTKRWTVRALLQASINIKPDVNANEYFDLFWDTDDDEARTCKVKVSRPVTKQSNELWSPLIPYSFQLLSPSEKIYAPTRKSAQFSLGILWWFPIPYTLPHPISGYGGYVTLNNEWNRHAPIQLQIVGKCTNPKIINITNGQKYRLNAVTNNLVYDNLNLDFDPTKLLVVEDMWQNVKNLRLSGGQIFLEPGINNLVVLSDDPSETPQIFIKYRDTFNY